MQEREGYLSLENRALEEATRGLAYAADAGDAPAVLAVVRSGFAVTLAVLAVANRLDKLIDCAFDLRIPVRTSEVGDDAHLEDAEGLA